MADSSFVCWLNGRKADSPAQVRTAHQDRELSIVIPTYNESGNIGRLIERLLTLLADIDAVIVVVDDRSSDETPEVVRRISERSESVVLLERIDKRGIFTAIQDGIALIESRFVAFMDADFSHPPEMIPRLFHEAQSVDIASASRYMRGGGIKAPARRILASRGLNGLCRIALGLPATDLLGGFHCMRRTSFDQLEFRYPALWGEFDLELFFRAKKLGFTLKELPFVYVFRDFGVSKSVDFKYGLAYLRQVFRLRFRG